MATTGEAKIKLIAGLGNPGFAYRDSYHNAGFLALGCLAHALAAPEFKTLKRLGFSYSKAGATILIKPLTYMNESGRAIGQAAKFFKVKAGEILIIHDDSDIGLGEFKISFGRGAAGHHGVESVIENLKTEKFWRLRVGIRPVLGEPQSAGNILKNNEKTPPGGNGPRFTGASYSRAKAGDFVLAAVKKPDRVVLYWVFEKAFGEIRKLIEKDRP